MIRIFKHYISAAYLWLMLIEWLMFFLAMYWGSAVRFLFKDSWYSPQQMLNAAIVYSLAFIFSCSALGLYRKTLDKEEYNLLERISFSFAVAIFMLVFVYYSIPGLMLARSVLFCAIGFSLLGMLLIRYLFYRFSSHDKLIRRVLVLGTGERAAELMQVNSQFVHRGFEIVGYIALENETTIVENPIIIGGNHTLSKVVAEANVDEVVIAPDDRGTDLPLDDLLDIKMSGILVMDLLTFYEREQRLVFLDVLSPSWLLFSDGFSNSGMRPVFKRLFDILACVLLLAVSWWVMLLTALAIYIEDGLRAPVFYRQQRVGYLNQPFAVIKFRSMRVDAEKNGAQWASTTDDRITKVGKVIRKYRIDELPQLINVFKGNMSFVGPRPERPVFVDGFVETIPYYMERHRVKPGITGWAQLCYPYGANEHDTRQKLQYDLYYVKNYSIFLDLAIMMSTVEVVLWGKGAR